MALTLTGMTTPHPRDTGVAETADVPAAPPPGPDATTVLSRPYRALSIGVVSVVLLIAFEATAVGTAMPVAARELDGVSLYAFAFSGYFTTSLFGMVLSGQWADRRGPLGPLTWGIASFAAGLLLAGTAGAMWLFILGRAVQGLGGGLVIVALYVIVGRAYPERLRPAIMAAFAASWVIPSVVGPLASGAVTEHLGWRWVFLGIPALVVLPLALALPQIRRLASGPVGGAPDSSDGRRIRLALAISAGAALVQYAAQDLRWMSLLPGALGLALLVPAVLGLLPRGTYRAARGLPSVVLLRGVAAGSFIAAESFVPLMLVTQRGLSPTLAGFSLAAGGGTWALGSWMQSRPRLEPYRERLMTLGMVLVAAAIAAAPERADRRGARLDGGGRLGLRLLRHGPGDLLDQRAAPPALRPGGGRHQLRRPADLRRPVQRGPARGRRRRLRGARRRRGEPHRHRGHRLPPGRLRGGLPADGGGGPGRRVGGHTGAAGIRMTPQGAARLPHFARRL